ncbi:MAG: DUF2442 domain-containing protein [Nitrospirota bacterium]|nr:DUF2442 domain-containing protein [Nitrospirota bacterium]MDX2420657.1 DUF2442 domain-containing protein [Nitrospirota bacterium]
MNKVISIKPKDNCILLITLSNGTSGEFDVSPYLEKGIFNELKDKNYFNQVRPISSGIAWPHEQDFSTDTIELEMKVLREANRQSVQLQAYKQSDLNEPPLHSLKPLAQET